VQNTNVTTTIGAGFINNTGAAITHLLIGYAGEQWRDLDCTLHDRRVQDAL